MIENADTKVIEDFGREWSQFDQSTVSKEELRNIFNGYFSVFPWEKLPKDAEGFDLGCGSGRWAYFCAPKVGKLHCIDPAAEALKVAKKKLSRFNNCYFHKTTVDNIPLKESSMDFGYSLGVLHHIPDTQKGIKTLVQKLKPGAPLLLYLYYAFDNKPKWFKVIWQVSDLLRRIIATLPSSLKYFVSQIIAALVYWPLSRLASLGESLGLNVDNLPLSAYRNKSFYTLRTDALDRFGTRLENRFTRSEIKEMMEKSGLEKIKFREEDSFWCAVGFRKS